MKLDDITRKHGNLHFTHEYDTMLNMLNHMFSSLFFWGEGGSIFAYSVSKFFLDCFLNIFFKIEIKNQLYMNSRWKRLFKNK